jgi:hypothetical protein
VDNLAIVVGMMVLLVEMEIEDAVEISILENVSTHCVKAIQFFMKKHRPTSGHCVQSEPIS